ncbi:hypothetical protein KCU83_g304, partial [Aureobasidium melanogenum]
MLELAPAYVLPVTRNVSSTYELGQDWKPGHPKLAQAHHFRRAPDTRTTRRCKKSLTKTLPIMVPTAINRARCPGTSAGEDGLPDLYKEVGLRTTQTRKPPLLCRASVLFAFLKILHGDVGPPKRDFGSGGVEGDANRSSFVLASERFVSVTLNRTYRLAEAVESSSRPVSNTNIASPAWLPSSPAKSTSSNLRMFQPRQVLWKSLGLRLMKSSISYEANSCRLHESCCKGLGGLRGAPLPRHLILQACRRCYVLGACDYRYTRTDHPARCNLTSTKALVSSSKRAKTICCENTERRTRDESDQTVGQRRDGRRFGDPDTANGFLDRQQLRDAQCRNRNAA